MAWRGVRIEDPESRVTRQQQKRISRDVGNVARECQAMPSAAAVQGRAGRRFSGPLPARKHANDIVGHEGVAHACPLVVQVVREQPEQVAVQGSQIKAAADAPIERRAVPEVGASGVRAGLRVDARVPPAAPAVMAETDVLAQRDPGNALTGDTSLALGTQDAGARIGIGRGNTIARHAMPPPSAVGVDCARGTAPAGDVVDHPVAVVVHGVTDLRSRRAWFGKAAQLTGGSARGQPLALA